MARYGLIDGYLDTMRTEIRWRRDLDDVVSEMEDHLYSTVEGLLASGVEPQAAQRATLDRFGEPDVLKAVYASSTPGGIAVPTRNTIRAGTISRFAGGLWLIAAVVYVLMILRDDAEANGWQVFYAIFTVALLAAGVLTVLAMIGVSRRSGGLGIPGMIGLAIASLGVLASIIAWAVPLWMGLLGIGLLVFGGAALNNGVAPKRSTMLASSGFIIGVILWVALNATKIGAVDSYGDYPVAWAIGGATGMTIVALGLIGWGQWLRSEEPVDIHTTAVAA
jgi:hypothetical protein